MYNKPQYFDSKCFRKAESLNFRKFIKYFIFIVSTVNINVFVLLRNVCILDFGENQNWLQFPVKIFSVTEVLLFLSHTRARVIKVHGKIIGSMTNY